MKIELLLVFFFVISLVFFTEAFAEKLEGYQTHEPMPTARQEIGVVAIGEKIYVMGGFDELERESRDLVEVYDTSKDVWYTVSPMPKKLNHVGIAVYEGKIFVVGGFEYTLPIVTNWVSTNYLFIYDPTTDTWTRGPDMPTARAAHAVEIIDGKLYAIGGLNLMTSGIASNFFETIYYSDNEVYDILSNTWEKRTPMPTARNHVASAIVDDKLYVIGGRMHFREPSFSVNEVYDPKTDSWQILEPMPTPRSGITAQVLNNTIFVFGGEDVQKSFTTNEQYVPGEGWFSHMPMTIPRHGLGSAIVNDQIYLIGGSGIPGAGRTNLNESYYNPIVIPEFNIVFFVLTLSVLTILIATKFGINRTKIMFKD